MALLVLSAFQRSSSHLSSVCGTPQALAVFPWRGEQTARSAQPLTDVPSGRQCPSSCRFASPSAERPWQAPCTSESAHPARGHEAATGFPSRNPVSLQHGIFLAPSGRQDPFAGDLRTESSQPPGNCSQGVGRLFHSSCSAQGRLEGDAAEFLDGRVARGSGVPLAAGAPGLTSTRREALALYRLVIRASRPFTWPNEDGLLWRDLLRASARQEFEACRGETNPELIARMLVQGRDAVDLVVEKFLKKREELLLREQNPLSAGRQQR